MSDLMFVFLIIISILLPLGIVFFAIGIFRTRGITASTTGVIIKKEVHIVINLTKIIKQEEFRERGTPDDRPTFQYEIDGVSYEKTSAMSQKPGFWPGTEVDVLYHPDDPQKALIDTFAQRGSVFTLIGSILFIICCLLAIAAFMYG